VRGTTLSESETRATFDCSHQFSELRMSRKRRSGEKMLIQKQSKVRVLGAAMILALMFVCSIAAFAAVVASSTSIQFPSTTVGTKSAAMPVTITNTGKSSVTITGAFVSSAQFSYSGPAFPIALEDGQSFTGFVTFSPAAAQAYKGTMIFSRRGGAAMASVALSGSGIAAAPKSALVVSPSALSFSAQVGGAAPAAQSLTIGENPAGATAFSVSADQSWITLSAASGTTSGAVSVGANISGLAAGSYSGHVIVSAAGVTNSPMSIPVSLVVAAAQASPYVLVAAPSSLAFTGAVGSVPACQALTVDDTTPGGPLPVVMSSDASWLTVTPASGNTKIVASVCVKSAGLVAGTRTGHVIATAIGANNVAQTVNNSPIAIPVSFVITGVAEALTAAPTAISFSAQVGGAAPAAQSLTIGENPAGAVAFTASADQAWIALSATSGTTSGAISVSANITGLAAGSYSGHVIVSAAGVTNSPMSIPVTLVVAAAQTHSLTAAPAAISFSAQAGAAAPAAQSLTIGEDPAGAVAFTASADQAWITLSATSGMTSGAISVSANITGLAAGSYSGHVIVSAAGVTNSPMSIPVTMVVAAAAASPYSLVMSPASLAFTGAVGSAPVCQALTVDDTTPGGPLPIVMSSDAAWLSVTPASGNTKLTSSVCVKTTGLAAGSFTGHIIATATGPNTVGQTVNNSPDSISVTLVITAAASNTLTATPSTLAFSGVVGGAVPAKQSLTIGENPTGTVAFTASADQAWMTLSATSGTTSSAIQVGANTAGLAAGNYTGHVIVTASGVSNSPMSVTVTLAVTAAQTSSLTVNPTSVAFGNINLANNNTKSVTITNSGTGSVTISQVNVLGLGISANGIATPTTLTAGQSTVLSIVYAPTLLGVVAGSVTVVSNATNSPTVILATGTGVQPQLATNPASLSFGNVATGASGSQTITLSNNGTAAATVSQVAVSGTGYSMSGITLPMTLAAGASTSVSVKFAPTATGSVSGSVTVTSNTPNSPTMVALSGTGTAAVVHSVSLAWAASTSTVVGYNVYRGSVSGGPYTMLTSTPDSALTYTDMAVTAGQTYFYVVTAVDANGNESIVSNEVQVLIPTT
jgi:hypothetical protein